MKCQKYGLAWASALALAVTVTPQVTTFGQTNGVIIIVTRYEQDISWFGEDTDVCYGMKVTGGGQCSQGDVAMAELLGDYGYPTRVIIDEELNAGPLGRANPLLGKTPDPGAYLAGGGGYQDSGVPGVPGAPTVINPDYKACLIIQSGSANSAYAPPLATNGIPYMTGEVQTFASKPNKPGSTFMYSGTTLDDNHYTTVGTNQWMKVTAAGAVHPILLGIPTNADGCIKIVRDPYPEESAHLPVGANALYEYDVPFVPVANAAPGTTVLGLLPSDPSQSIFGVVDVGGLLANGQTATARMVHYFVSEGGQDSYRRCFNGLSDIGRVIFVRAAKWAMGETLTPFVPLGVIKVSQVGPSQIRLMWDGTATKNYKVLGTHNIAGPWGYNNWRTVGGTWCGLVQVSGRAKAQLKPR